MKLQPSSLVRGRAGFDVCHEVLRMFHQSVEANIFYAVICWGGNVTYRDTRRTDKLVNKAGSVLSLDISDNPFTTSS